VTLVFALKPRRRFPHTPQVLPPPDLLRDRIRRIHYHDDQPTQHISFWTHLSLDCYPDLYRLTVTTELLPCGPYQRNTKRHRWENREATEFTEYADRSRSIDVPRQLANISDVVDAALLRRTRAYQVVPVRATYADTGFHFLPTDGDNRMSMDAYREFPTNFGVDDPLELLNTIAKPPLSLQRFTATITLCGE
jgi:hypothetical protein